MFNLLNVYLIIESSIIFRVEVYLSSNIQTRRIRSVVSGTNLDVKAPSRTNQLIDAAHIVATTQLVPEIRQMTRNSISFDRREIYYYYKKTIGRECSCVEQNNMASGTCQICWKTGWVGGYDKYGTITEVIDCTAVFSSCNLIVNPITRPHTIELSEEAYFGYAFWTIPLKQNLGVVDLLQIIDYQEFGTIKYSIDTPSGWAELNEVNLKKRLNDNELTIMVEFNRNNLQLNSPKLICIRIRYTNKPTLWVNCDFEHPKDSRALSEFGIYSNWSSQSANLDDTLGLIHPEDWLFRSDRNELWKVLETDRLDQLSILTGTNITLRLIQPHEILNLYPK